VPIKNIAITVDLSATWCAKKKIFRGQELNRILTHPINVMHIATDSNECWFERVSHFVTFHQQLCLVNVVGLYNNKTVLCALRRNSMKLRAPTRGYVMLYNN
jgi:hypothetical protein